MNHYPLLTLNDETEITYSDIKDGGHIVFYCETPDEELGFKNARINYPFTGKGFYDILGYSTEELDDLFFYVKRLAPLAYDLSEERADLKTPSMKGEKKLCP